MSDDAMRRKFSAAKQEVQQVAAAEQKVPESYDADGYAEFLKMKKQYGNQQLQDILKALDKLAKQNENFQEKIATNVKLDLQNYLDSHVVDATAAILRKHTEENEKLQRHIGYYIQKINEKLEILLGLMGMTFVSIAGFIIYRYFLR